MEKRENIDPKYKWNLSCYIKNDKMLEEEFKYIEETYPTFKKYNKKFNNKEALLEYFNKSKEFNIRVGRLYGYIYNTLNEDISNTKFKKLSSRLEFLMNDVNQTLSFIDPQLKNLKTEYLKELLLDERFKNLKRFINSLIKSKKHKIDEKTSALISKMGLFLGAADECFDELTTSEIEFDNIEVDGEKFSVNEANYSKLMKNKNREVRRLAINSLMNGYGKLNKTLTATLVNNANKEIFFAQLEKFKSLKEQALFDEEVSSKVYNKLIEQVNKHLPLLFETFELRRKNLKLEKIAYYDLMLDFNNKQEYTVEEGVKLVQSATEVLGEEYTKLLEEKFSQNVIDFLPNKDKATGAYSTGSYGCPSIVLMNYVEDYNSVSTLAHEIGHAMHTEFSDRFQPYETSDYVIFVAEVASTVNELLLDNFLMKNADKQTKQAIIFELFSKVRSTIFRQTMFSEFEDYLYSSLENKQPISYEDLNNYYFDLNKKYYGKDVELPEELKFEWSRIPHFYRPYYVYKYATGLISALCIVQKLTTEKDYYKQYVNFLKSGSSKTPVELLQDIDVDLTTNKPYELAFKYIRKQLDELKSI